VHPDAQLELQAARRGLVADEPQHLEIAIALGIGQTLGAHVVTGNRKEERVGEQEIGVRHILQKIVAESETEIEAIETVRGEHGQVARPHLAIVEPRFIFHVARE
jgi:hypothetical protein